MAPRRDGPGRRVADPDERPDTVVLGHGAGRMTAARTFRAVPLASLRAPAAEVTVSAESVLAALEKAKLCLGVGTPFDLCDGAEVVLVYRPSRRWRPVRHDPDRG